MLTALAAPMVERDARFGRTGRQRARLNILAKLGASSRGEAVAIARNSGLV